MRIMDLPDAERPREKLLQRGTDALSDGELLAILLRHGTKNHSALAIAQQLLQQFGSLRQVFNLSLNDFCQIKGLGVSHYTQLQAALALGQRVFKQDIPRRLRFDNFTGLEKFLLSKLAMHEREVFAVIFLNAKLEIIAYEELFYGSIHHATVHPREFIKRILTHNASAIILAHNHPSGDPTPSQQDFEITEILQDSIKWLEVKIIQHVVVGHKHCIAILD